MTAAVARRYYLHGESKVEIADALGISRFKVARLLESARTEGVVRIEIVSDETIDPELSSRLQEALGLQHCVVVAVDSDPVVARDRVGRTAADLLVEVIGPDDVLGLPWSRTVYRMVTALTSLPPNPVVQLTGSLVLPEAGSSSDVVRRAAQIAGGEAHVFYAPMILDDAESARIIRRQPPVSYALSQIDRVTIAVVGVGAWASGASTIHDVVSERTRHEVARSGAIGEVCGILFDRDGQHVANSLSARLITPSNKQLRAIPEVIGLATGIEKTRAIAAAVRSGLVTSLVTSSATAEELLALRSQ